MGELVHTGAAAARPWLRNATKITDEVKHRFLFALTEVGNEGEAAAIAGVSISGIRRHADPDQPCFDPEFAEAWAEAREAFIASLHKAAVKRAVDGWLEPMIGGEMKDQIVAYKPMFSDRLLEILLKRYDPQYRDRVSIDHTKVVQHNHRLDMSKLTPAQRQMARALLDATAPKVIDVQAEPVPVAVPQAPDAPDE